MWGTITIYQRGEDTPLRGLNPDIHRCTGTTPHPLAHRIEVRFYPEPKFIPPWGPFSRYINIDSPILDLNVDIGVGNIENESTPGI